MIIGAAIWAGLKQKGYGILPTFAIGVATENTHTFITLLVFIIGTMIEAVALVFMLEKVRLIKKEFSMLAEL